MLRLLHKFAQEAIMKTMKVGSSMKFVEVLKMIKTHLILRAISRLDRIRAGSVQRHYYSSFTTSAEKENLAHTPYQGSV